jgi:excinuclease UvrABC nuclease subunit
MPFSGPAYLFNQRVIATANEVGAVYGLFKPSSQAGYFTCLYVGKTDNLRRRLSEHLNNPPIVGVTHWFAEVQSNELQRTLREAQLITEFQPAGNTVGRR